MFRDTHKGMKCGYQGNWNNSTSRWEVLETASLANWRMVRLKLKLRAGGVESVIICSGASPLGCKPHQLESTDGREALRTAYPTVFASVSIMLELYVLYAIAMCAMWQLNVQWPGILFALLYYAHRWVFMRTYRCLKPLHRTTGRSRWVVWSLSVMCSMQQRLESSFKKIPRPFRKTGFPKLFVMLSKIIEWVFYQLPFPKDFLMVK